MPADCGWLGEAVKEAVLGLRRRCGEENTGVPCNAECILRTFDFASTQTVCGLTV